MYIKKAGRKYYNQKDKFDKRYGCKSRQKPLHIEFLSGRFHSHRHRIFYSLYFYRLGNIKKIYIDGFKNIPVGKTTVICTIPKDYLPTISDYSWDKSNVSEQPYRIGLLRNGSLSIHVYTSSFSGENNTIFDEVYF